MLLKSLHLRNYRRYRDQYLEFPNGMIGIVGRNGTGKSTLIEAVGWCIYGRARTANSEIRTSSAPQGAECSAQLEIEVGQDRFTVERKLRGPSSTASVYVNGGNTAQATGGNVSDFMATRIGMDHTAFITSIFAQQKELDAFSNLRPNERKKIVMRLLGINNVDHAITRIRQDRATAERETNALKEAAQDMDALRTDRSKNLQRRSTTAARLRKAKSLQSSHEKTAALLQKNVKKQENLRNAHDRAAAKLTQYTTLERSKTESAKDAVKELGEARKAQAILDSLLPQVEGYEEEKDRVGEMERALLEFRELELTKAQIKTLKARMKGELKKNSTATTKLLKLGNPDLEMDEASRRLECLESDKSILDKKCSGLNQKGHGARTEMKKISSDLESIRSLGEGACPTCRRPLGNHREPTIRRMEERMASLRKTAYDIEAETKIVDAMIEKASKKIQLEKDNIKSLGAKARDKTRLGATLASGEESLKNTEDEIKAREQKAARFEDLRYDKREHARAKLRLAATSKKRDRAIGLRKDADRAPGLEAKILALEGEADKAGENMKEQKAVMNGIGFDRKLYRATKKRAEAASKAHHNQTVLTTGLEGDLKLIALSLQQIENSISREKARAKKIERLDKRTETLSKLEALMNDFKTDLMARIRPALSDKMSELLSRMTNGRYQSVEIDDSYGITIGDAGSSFATDRFSGGEQDLASLCLRLAISQELSDRAGIAGSNFVALDEIFGSQDVERKAKVLSVLSELSNQFKQILLITHIEDVKESLPYALHVIESPDGTVRIDVEGRRPG